MTSIPSNILELSQIFENKKYQVNTSTIETDFILEEQLFSKTKSYAKDVQRVWHLIDEGDIFHVWVVQSEKWYLKSWRKQIARNFQFREFADQLIFFVPVDNEQSQWKTYSLIVITEDGIDPIDSIDPIHPSAEVARFWEQLADPNFSFSDYEPVSIAQQAAHALTADKIFKKLESSNEELLGIFEEAGLSLHDDRFILPREDAPLYNLGILDVQLDESKPIDFLKNNIDVYKKIENETYRSIKFILLLTQSSLIIADISGSIYGTSFIKKKKTFLLENPFTWNKKENQKALDIITSLIAVIDTRTIFNAETFAQQYGRWSLLSVWAQNIMLNYLNSNFSSIDVLYSEWERRFSEVYKKNDTTIELFIQHSYLAYLVKLVLLEQYSDRIQVENPSFNDLLEYLNEKKISLFAHDFFHWVEFIPELHELLFNTVHGADFDSTDIFRVIYQQMISPSTRRALGEFYTPPKLAELMVDKIYKLNNNVLDPACGSGTFLVEIIKNIRRRGLSVSEQLKAIQNIYGFDINPVAVAVSKVNLLLQLSTISEEPTPINIFLCNSLFPVEYKQRKHGKIKTKLDTGKYLIFPMNSINQFIEIPALFYKPENCELFADVLRNLDLLLLEEDLSEEDFINKLEQELSNPEFSWLNEVTGFFDTPLKNILSINIFFNGVSKNPI